MDSMEDLVGNTPLLRVRAFDSQIKCQLLLKLELCNPGGSIKDRTALALIEYGERQGLLRPGGIIVEPTSGNTGVGLAMVAAQRGYPCIFTVREKVSKEKIALLEAYGADVVVCPSDVPRDDPDSYYSVAIRIAKSIDGAYMPNQYENEANRQAHYATTGPELWSQTSGQITHFVASAGTGGSISGAGAYLKKQSADVEVVCIDPEGSIFSGEPLRPFLIEGAGSDFIPANYDSRVIDRIDTIADLDAIKMCHRLVAELGLLTGGSGGMVVAGALRVAEKAEETAVVVALVPDSGRGYLSKVYSPAWLSMNGLPGGQDADDFVPAICGFTLHMDQIERRNRQSRAAQMNRSQRHLD